jgi:hypothetical protein
MQTNKFKIREGDQRQRPSSFEEEGNYLQIFFLKHEKNLTTYLGKVKKSKTYLINYY